MLFWVTLAVWGRALYRWNISLCRTRFFCGCKVLLPISWRFHRHICQLPVRRQKRNVHFDLRGCVHHIFGEETWIIAEPNSAPVP